MESDSANIPPSLYTTTYKNYIALIANDKELQSHLSRLRMSVSKRLVRLQHNMSVGDLKDAMTHSGTSSFQEWGSRTIRELGSVGPCHVNLSDGEDSVSVRLITIKRLPIYATEQRSQLAGIQRQVVSVLSISVDITSQQYLISNPGQQHSTKMYGR